MENPLEKGLMAAAAMMISMPRYQCSYNDDYCSHQKRKPSGKKRTKNKAARKARKINRRK